MDYNSREGAEVLKSRIEQYWAGKGHSVQVWIQAGKYHGTMRTGYWDVKTNLVNGWPS